VGGSQPTAAVTLTVAKGLYSVLLGDATLPNLTIVPAAVFTNAGVYVRVWFNDGTHGFQLLTPDQRIAAVGYAMMAGNVPDGAITGAKIAAGAVGGTQLANGAVGSSKLAPGAAAANLHAISQTAVPSGGLVLSATENTALVNAGYVRIGTTTTSDTWQQRTNGTPPAGRHIHTAVWTGSEMIVWGGQTGGSHFSDGGRYHPALNSWTAISAAGAPGVRGFHTAVWTGSEMIIWGGSTLPNLNDGARYNPAANVWTPTSTTGAPAARFDHTAIWTGREMIVWGGVTNTFPV
jgi:hypothetical protein